MKIHPALKQLAADRNIDLEDVESAVKLVESGDVSKTQLREWFRREQDVAEPNAYARAKSFLDSDRPVPMKNRAVTYTDREAPLVAEGLKKLVGAVPGMDLPEQIKEFQRQQGLHPSGVLDTATMAAMNVALVQQGEPVVDVTPRIGIASGMVLLSPNDDSAEAVPQIRKLQAALVILSRVMDREEYGLIRYHIDGDFGGETSGALKAFQVDHHLSPTGIVDLNTLEALNGELRSHGCPTFNIVPPGDRGADLDVNLRPLEMHFLPEEDKLYICRRHDDDRLEVVEEHPLRGGPRTTTTDDRGDVSHTAGPTKPGHYKIGTISRHQSGTRGWYNSLFKWGTKFRLKDGEVQFQDPRYRGHDGHWDWATGPNSYFKRNGYPQSLQPQKRDLLDREGKPIDFWRANDFGHMRGTLIDVRTGSMRPEMLHPTPDLERRYGEQFTPQDLAYSHGCMHVDPMLMDRLIGEGMLRSGTTFHVHGYGETFADDVADPPIA